MVRDLERCTGRNAEAAENTAATCREAGPQAASYRLDVTDRRGMEVLAAHVAAEHGDVDIVINNAGVGMSGRFTDVTAGDWEWIRSVNLDGVVNGCAVFAPGMLARGRGRIVNLSSGLAYLSPRTEPAYVATKAAVLALSRSLRGDFAQYGVGVTAICPGITDTPIVDNRQATADLTPISFGHELTRLQRTRACSASALKKSDFFPALKGIPTSRRSHHPTDRWIEASRWRGSIRAARES